MMIKKAFLAVTILFISPSINSTEISSETTRAIIAASTDAELRDLIEQGNVVIDFFMPGCGPCLSLSRALDNIVSFFPSVTFVKVDCLRNRALATAWGVRSTPTIFFFKDGQQVHKENKFPGEGPLRSLLAKVYA